MLKIADTQIAWNSNCPFKHISVRRIHQRSAQLVDTPGPMWCRSLAPGAGLEVALEANPAAEVAFIYSAKASGDLAFRRHLEDLT